MVSDIASAQTYVIEPTRRGSRKLRASRMLRRVTDIERHLRLVETPTPPAARGIRKETQMDDMDRIILEAVAARAGVGITFEKIIDLPDFDDDEVIDRLAWLRDDGMIYQWDDGGPSDDFVLRYYPTLEGVVVLIGDDEGLTPDQALQLWSAPEPPRLKRKRKTPSR
jgi:hypothetical protein